MIYIGSKTADTIYIGSTSNPIIYAGSTKVFPTGTVTHKITAVSLVYSSGTYLYPDQSNYAYVSGTYVTYVDGVKTSEDTVECTPTYSYLSARVVLKGNKFYWNKDSYGSSSVTASSMTVTGGKYDDSSLSKSMSLAYGANSSTFASASIDSFTASPTTIGSSSQKIYTTIKGTRNYKWTSGNTSSTSVSGGSYSSELEGYISARQYQGGDAVDVTYTFTNNGSSEVTLTGKVYIEVGWTDPDEGYTEDWAEDTATLTLAAGESNSISLRAEMGIPSAYYPSMKDEQYTFCMENDTTDYSLSETEQTYVISVSYGTGIYTLSSSDSWITASNLIATASQNTGSTRTGTIKVVDNLYSSAAASVSITQT